MNFNDIFKSRDKSFVALSEAADYLGRRLRENLVIFNIDDTKSEISFISEKNHLIECNYDFENERVVLENFKVTEVDELYSDERVDQQVTESVSNFVRSLHESRYDSAETAFDTLVESFTVRGQIDETRRKLERKLARFGDAYNITETKTYHKFNEALPIFEKLVQEKREELFEDDNLMEGLKLVGLVAKAYDMPRLNLENIGDELVMVEPNKDKTLYEMVCNTELVRKELLEAKEAFASMWASNGSIANLASCIYATPEVVKEALVEAVKDIPYLALANKSELVRVMESTFEVNDPGTITQKEVKEFVDQIFEMKKPIKEQVLNTLNETYGVNVQSLKFVPSFKGLSKIHGDLFEMLAEYCDSGILEDVLSEMAAMMRKKGGVEVLDVAQVVTEAFEKAGIEINKQQLFNVDNLKDDLQEADYYGDDDEMSNTSGKCGDEDKKKDDKKKKKKDDKEEDSEDEKEEKPAKKDDEEEDKKVDESTESEKEVITEGVEEELEAEDVPVEEEEEDESREVDQRDLQELTQELADILDQLDLDAIEDPEGEEEEEFDR